MNKYSTLAGEIFQSPLKLVVIFLFVVPCADMLLALFLQLFPGLPGLLSAFIDSVLLVVVLAPVVYFLAFQPVIRDISRRKTAELALRESEEKYKSLFEEALTANYIMTDDGMVTDCNNTFLEMFGYHHKAEILGKKITMLYEDFSEFEWIKNRLHKERKLTNYESVRKSRDGRRIDIIENKIAKFDEQGEISEIQTYIYDITERKKAEEALKEREIRLRELIATKDKFFSIIAHDLKNPFNSIIGFSSVLSEQIREKNYENIEEYAEFIESSAKHVMDLLINLLDWSLSQTGRMEFKPQYFDMVNVIENIIELSENPAKQKSISIIREMPAEIQIFADKAMISLVIRNLISNAIKFTNPGGMIRVSAEEKDWGITVSVADNGVGIQKEVIGKLFRLDGNNATTGTQNETGTGLGLILCKEFVEKHHGSILAESEEGQGSTFRFTLPVKKISLHPGRPQANTRV